MVQNRFWFNKHLTCQQLLTPWRITEAELHEVTFWKGNNVWASSIKSLSAALGTMCSIMSASKLNNTSSNATTNSWKGDAVAPLKRNLLLWSATFWSWNHIGFSQFLRSSAFSSTLVAESSKVSLLCSCSWTQNSYFDSLFSDALSGGLSPIFSAT